jgi:hypothetical protein
MSRKKEKNIFIKKEKKFLTFKKYTFKNNKSNLIKILCKKKTLHNTKQKKIF